MTMITPVKLSANLGMLWTELELCDAVRAAKRAGFDAVEVHWPYITHSLEVALTLEETGLPLLSLNTVAGDLAQGDFGLAAVPGREPEARTTIDKAFAYAADTSAVWVHVLAGLSEGSQAEIAYLNNLRYAAKKGREYGVGVLIEPMCEAARPGYFLRTVEQAARMVAEIGEPNVRMLFDCYHAAMSGCDLQTAISDNLDDIGHIQFASIPDRAEPDGGEVDYSRLIPSIVEAGYTGFFGAEYRPALTTDLGLGWMDSFR
jgi:hydroxypyruvate isomerase